MNVVMDTSFSSESSLMEQLSSQIATHVSTISNGLRANNLPFPTFNKDGPRAFPPNAPLDAVLARGALIQACQDLLNLTLGPTDMLRGHFVSHKFEIASLRAINTFEVPEAVPMDGEASYSEIAKRTGVDEDWISRMIRFAITSNIFQEHRPGFVSHTAASALLVEDKGLRAVMRHHLNETGPIAFTMNEAVKKFGVSEEPNETAFNIVHNTDKQCFDWLSLPENKEELENMHQTMAYLQVGLFDTKWATHSPLWDNVKQGSLVVDVGGSTGHVSMAIARKYPSFKFIVQDFSASIEDHQKDLPSEFNDQISFMKHDFFEPQKTEADVYVLRFVLHDWSDKYAMKILRNIISVLRPGARIAIMETILPPPNTAPKFVEKLQRCIDLQMLACVNAKERSMEQWEALFKKTDPRLKIFDVASPAGSVYSIIVIGLSEE